VTYCVMGTLLVLSRPGAAQQLPPDCPPENARPAIMLAYIRQDRAGLDRGCIERAIHFLGLTRYKPALPALIDYLDAKAPGPPFLGKPGPTGDLFPAAGALEAFGSTAAPALKKAILDDNERKLVRVNAAKTYIYISLRDEAPAIAFVAKAARNSMDRNAGEALMKVAEDEAKNCFAKDKKVCEDALKE
jgi:hypothetical protein